MFCIVPETEPMALPGFGGTETPGSAGSDVAPPIGPISRELNTRLLILPEHKKAPISLVPQLSVKIARPDPQLLALFPSYVMGAPGVPNQFSVIPGLHTL